MKKVCIAIFILLTTACGSTAVRSLPVDKEKTVLSKATASGGCGRELWSIKTLTDGYASQVDLSPRRATIASLVALPAPSFSYVRSRTSDEEKTYKLVGTRLTGWKLESDSDYHLVLKSPKTGATMIAEIPDPHCATGSRVYHQIVRARNSFIAAGFNAGNECFRCVDEPVTIIGVGFFDALHGQSGVAPNGFELHPVLSFKRMKIASSPR